MNCNCRACSFGHPLECERPVTAPTPAGQAPADRGEAVRHLGQIIDELRGDEDASIPPHVPLLIEALTDVYEVLRGETR